AATSAAQAIRAGDADVVLAGGVESMTRAPWVQAKPARPWAGPGPQFDTSIGWRFTNPALAARDKAAYSMPDTADEVARTDAASAAGHLDDEILPITVDLGRRGPRTVTADEGPRPDTSLAALAELRPVVTGGSVVTAGNSSSLNDGSSALLLASRAAVEKYQLSPRARIVAATAAALAPEVMGLGPVPATEKALARAGLATEDIGAIELNEAFAAQALACIRRLQLDPRRVNTDGGAIALGHPLGSSGSRLLVTLLARMEREDARYGLATMCVGVGQGTAMI